MEGGKKPPRVVAVLAGLLERAAERCDAGGTVGSGASAFRGPTKPAISVQRYAERIWRYAGCSSACFVVAYVYLDRLRAAVDSYTVHRLLITAVMVAAKFMDDIHYNNAYFARVGGIEVAEMNSLELEFLFGVQFDLNVAPALFDSYCAALEGEMSLQEASAPPAGRRVFLPEEDLEAQKAKSRAFTQRAAVEITQ